MKRPFTKGYCCYCKRHLTPALPECSTSITFDHFTAESQGGRRKVPCCRKCNQLKGDLTPANWLWFIDTHPRWWKLYDTAEQVAAKVREFRFAQAKARGAELQRIIDRNTRRNAA